MILHWNVSPELFSIGPLAPRWYGLFFLAGFIFGQHFVANIFAKMGQDRKEAATLTNYLIAGTAIGARIAHCFFYEPEYYLANLWEVPMVWKGGLASHGGYIGVALAALIFYSSRKKWLRPVELLDIVTFPALLTGSLIRLGNFFNSEILGRPTDGSWGIVFERVDQIPRHPAQLYESLGYFLISLLVLYLYKRKTAVWGDGRVLGSALAISFFFRFFVELVKENQVPFEEGLFLNMGQMLSIPLMMIGAYLIIWPVKIPGQKKK